MVYTETILTACVFFSFLFCLACSLHCQNCRISYPRKSSKFPELLLFLNQEIFCGFPLQGKAETGIMKVSKRKSMYQNFLIGNLLKISLAFPLHFLVGKLKNTGSVSMFRNMARIK